MSKYYQTDQLQKMIDWKNIMKMPRCAGGHNDQMIGLFKDSTLIAHWNEGDYQGMVATCVKLPDGKYAIYNDFYGSCSGCDAWDGADDDQVRNMCINLSNSTYVFENMVDIIEFLKSEKKDGYSWGNNTSKKLLEAISQNLQYMRDMVIDKII